MSKNIPCPLIDVVLPVFNGSKTIVRAIQSVDSQTAHCDLRVIAVDDFSSDNSIELIRNLRYSQIKLEIIKNPKNLGNAHSRNIGIKSSQAAYIALLDQDDVWVPEKLDLQLAAFSENPKIQYVVGMQEFVLDDPNQIPSWFNSKWQAAPQPGYLPSILLAKRELFQTVGLFHEELRLGSDTAWFAKARGLDIPHRLIPQVLVRRGIHDKNLSSDPQTNSDLLAAIRIHLKEQS
jgi:glycosyltransferase involved in cell wall biosynthesis